MKKVLLLTGCVNPNGMSFTYLNDVHERKKQYLNALKWYLENTEFEIVFVENSNTDLSSCFENIEHRQRLEFLTFNGNDFDKSLGKGFGEANIIEYAFDKSKKIVNADLIAKITGRLIVSNVVELFNACNNAHCLYIKETYVNRVCYASQFLVAPPIVYKLIISNKFKLDDSSGYYFEYLLYDLTQNCNKSQFVVKEIFPPIKLSGVSGSTGGVYKYTCMSWVKNYIKFFLHKLGFHFC